MKKNENYFNFLLLILTIFNFFFAGYVSRNFTLPWVKSENFSWCSSRPIINSEYYLYRNNFISTIIGVSFRPVE